MTRTRCMAVWPAVVGAAVVVGAGCGDSGSGAGTSEVSSASSGESEGFVGVCEPVASSGVMPDHSGVDPVGGALARVMLAVDRFGDGAGAYVDVDGVIVASFVWDVAGREAELQALSPNVEVRVRHVEYSAVALSPAVYSLTGYLEQVPVGDLPQAFRGAAHFDGVRNQVAIELADPASAVEVLGPVMSPPFDRFCVSPTPYEGPGAP